MGKDDPLNLSCRLKGIQTNLRAEIAAVIAALKQAIEQKYEKLVIITDCMYVIESICINSHKWKENGWKTAKGTQVIHKKEFIEILQLQDQLEVVWRHVSAHKGEKGNGEADKLAKKGVNKKNL